MTLSKATLAFSFWESPQKLDNKESKGSGKLKYPGLRELPQQ